MREMSFYLSKEKSPLNFLNGWAYRNGLYKRLAELWPFLAYSGFSFSFAHHFKIKPIKLEV